MATIRGRRVYSTEAYGNAYFFPGDGCEKGGERGGELGTILCKEYNNVRMKGRGSLWVADRVLKGSSKDLLARARVEGNRENSRGREGRKEG